MVQGEEFILTTDEIIGDNKRATVSLKTLPHSLKKNDLIFINDGIIGLKVKKIEHHEIFCESLSSGKIRSKKGINIPNVKLDVPCLTPKDLRDLEFALPLEPDYIALSFVRHSEDVSSLREIIQNSDLDVPIVSKIEHAFAVKNFDKILNESDAIMVARGDLGIETSVTLLPIVQKELIRKCNHFYK